MRSSRESRFSEIRNNSGSIDTDMMALTVVPCGRGLSIAVAIETGQAMCAMASLNAARSGLIVTSRAGSRSVVPTDRKSVV